MSTFNPFVALQAILSHAFAVRPETAMDYNTAL
jgi:hypothetical protein